MCSCLGIPGGGGGDHAVLPKFFSCSVGEGLPQSYSLKRSLALHMPSVGPSLLQDILCVSFDTVCLFSHELAGASDV